MRGGGVSSAPTSAQNVIYSGLIPSPGAALTSQHLLLTTQRDNPRQHVTGQHVHGNPKDRHGLGQRCAAIVINIFCGPVRTAPLAYLSRRTMETAGLLAFFQGAQVWTPPFHPAKNVAQTICFAIFPLGRRLEILAGKDIAAQVDSQNIV